MIGVVYHLASIAVSAVTIWLMSQTGLGSLSLPRVGVGADEKPFAVLPLGDANRLRTDGNDRSCAILEEKVARGQRLSGFDDHLDQEIGIAVAVDVAADAPQAGAGIVGGAHFARRAAQPAAVVEDEGLIAGRLCVRVDQAQVDPVAAVLEVVDPVLGAEETVAGAAILEQVGPAPATQRVRAAAA